jgi:hypothetical protein
MVICSECGARVSPKVLACPKCSAPVDATGVTQRNPPRGLPPWWMIAGGLALLVAAGIGSYFIFR